MTRSRGDMAETSGRTGSVSVALLRYCSQGREVVGLQTQIPQRNIFCKMDPFLKKGRGGTQREAEGRKRLGPPRCLPAVPPAPGTTSVLIRPPATRSESFLVSHSRAQVSVPLASPPFCVTSRHDTARKRQSDRLLEFQPSWHRVQAQRHHHEGAKDTCVCSPG